MLNQQLERVQEYLSRLDKQMAEVVALKEAIDRFSGISEGEEVLAPLAAGVFLRATATGDKTLRVNVGQGVVVPKTVPEVHAMLDEQLGEMRAYEQELHSQFDQLLGKLAQMQQEFEKEK